jgi:hypothetical protein
MDVPSALGTHRFCIECLIFYTWYIYMHLVQLHIMLVIVPKNLIFMNGFFERVGDALTMSI